MDQAIADGAKSAVKPIISFRSVSKRWGSTVGVDNVSLDIEPGEFFALLGPSGCGKTTLLRVAAGIEKPSAGRILINDQDIRDVTQKSLRRAIGIVPQDTVLFNDSIYYNIAYGRPDATHDEIIAEVRTAKKSERENRVIDLTSDSSMEQKKKEGYF